MDYKKIIDDLKWVRSAVKARPPLREAGLEYPVFYAFQARAEWEMLILADVMGEQLQKEYRLYPAGQSGVGLDWRKLNKRIWIPADYLEARSISENGRSIFSHDEANCVSQFVATPEELELRNKVIYGLDSQGSSEAKINALLTDSKWRALARDYSLILLDSAGRGTKYVKEEFRPVLEALISAYCSEMQ